MINNCIKRISYLPHSVCKHSPERVKPSNIHFTHWFSLGNGSRLNFRPAAVSRRPEVVNDPGAFGRSFIARAGHLATLEQWDAPQVSALLHSLPYYANLVFWLLIVPVDRTSQTYGPPATIDIKVTTDIEGETPSHTVSCAVNDD